LPPVAAHRLAQDEAGPIAIGAQMLDANRPQALLEVVERLTFPQIDPTAAIAPSAEYFTGTTRARPRAAESVRRHVIRGSDHYRADTVAVDGSS
jgi:hypothetical protein